MSFLRKLCGDRNHKKINLYQCGDCKSLYNPSGYREDDVALIGDTMWHVNEFKKNVSFGRDIISTLKKANPNAKSLLDIGAGIGSLISLGDEFGLEADGIEPNPYAVLYGKRVLSLDITCSYFNKTVFDKKFDAITLISVLEHLEEPRLLFEDAVKCLNKKGVMFVHVPFYIPEIHQKYLEEPQLEGSIFTTSDVHIVHFTKEGFEKMAKESNATSLKQVLGGYVLTFD
jgi:SAM-dependent methyltransferase